MGAHSSDQDKVLAIAVLESVSAASARGAVSIADVAEQLGLDRSGASRMVSLAVERGFLRKQASAGDARRVELTLTKAGLEFLDASRAWQEEVFRSLTARWPVRDREHFSRCLRRLASELTLPLEPGGRP